MMAWTATMASLILVWSSLSSSMCSRRRIWAASFRVASENTFILGYNCELRFVNDHWGEAHLRCQNPMCACPKLLGHPGKDRYMYNLKMYIRWRIRINHFIWIFTSPPYDFIIQVYLNCDPSRRFNLHLNWCRKHPQVKLIPTGMRLVTSNTSLLWLALAMASGESLSWIRIRMA